MEEPKSKMTVNLFKLFFPKKEGHPGLFFYPCFEQCSHKSLQGLKKLLQEHEAQRREQGQKPIDAAPPTSHEDLDLLRVFKKELRQGYGSIPRAFRMVLDEDGDG